MVNIKKYIFICLMSFSCAVYAREFDSEELILGEYKENDYFKNIYMISETVEKPTPSNLQGNRYKRIYSKKYKFKLIKKISESIGYFSIICDASIYNEEVIRNGGTPFAYAYESNEVIVIYYFLKYMKDGDTIELKDKHRLYSVGYMRGIGEHYFKVHSFNKKDVIVCKFCNGIGHVTHRKITCKYCNGTGGVGATIHFWNGKIY